MKHDWVRAVLYRTNERDIAEGVMMLAEPVRVALGAPGCLNCGKPYPAPSPCTGEPGDGEKAVDPAAFEPLQRKSRDARTRSTGSAG